MSVITATTNNFQTEVLNYQGKVIVDFWAPWCGPCQMLSPLIEEIAATDKTLKVVKLNVDEDPDIASQYNVSAIPTVIIFDHGKIKNIIVGFRQKQDYLAALV